MMVFCRRVRIKNRVKRKINGEKKKEKRITIKKPDLVKKDTKNKKKTIFTLGLLKEKKAEM